MDPICWLAFSVFVMAVAILVVGFFGKKQEINVNFLMEQSDDGDDFLDEYDTSDYEPATKK